MLEETNRLEFGDEVLVDNCSGIIYINIFMNLSMKEK